MELSTAQTRDEAITNCSSISRDLVKEKYFTNSEVKLLEMTRWLSYEEPSNNRYKFTIYTKIQKSDLELYSWTFSVYTQFNINTCQILSETFEHETKLIADETDDYFEDDQD